MLQSGLQTSECTFSEAEAEDMRDRQAPGLASVRLCRHPQPQSLTPTEALPEVGAWVPVKKTNAPWSEHVVPSHRQLFMRLVLSDSITEFVPVTVCGRKACKMLGTGLRVQVFRCGTRDSACQVQTLSARWPSREGVEPRGLPITFYDLSAFFKM